MIRNIAIIVLAAALVVTGYWAYHENQQKNAALTHSENHYQQAFHELAYHIDELHDNIGTALVMRSGHSMVPALAQVWRISSMAHKEVGQLPLTLMPFDNTQAFLSKIGEFSYALTKRNLTKNPLTRKEYHRLQELYKQSSDIENQLRGVQATIIKNHLNWMDVRTALAAQKEPMDNMIVDGLRTVDHKVQGYDDVDWGPDISQTSKNKEDHLKSLTGKTISSLQAKEIARKFNGFGKNVPVSIRTSGKHSDYNVYSATMKNPKNGATIHMDISKKGGHPLWMVENVKNQKPRIGLNQASQIAATFLKKHGKQHMEMTQSNQYDSVGMFTFVNVLNHVRVYPEAIRLKVSLDHKKVVGFEATDDVAFHKDGRAFSKETAISEKQALKSVNKNVDVKIVRKAVITNDMGKEVLCYEILGTMGNDTYRIFINADTGQAEKVNRVNTAHSIYQTT